MSDVAPTRALVDLLNPGVIRCSTRFTAMLGYILDEPWTQPRIIGMIETSDGILLVETEDDPFANEIIGDSSELWRNLRGLAAAAELTEAETARLLLLARTRVRQA